MGQKAWLQAGAVEAEKEVLILNQVGVLIII